MSYKSIRLDNVAGKTPIVDTGIYIFIAILFTVYSDSTVIQTSLKYRKIITYAVDLFWVMDSWLFFNQTRKTPKDHGIRMNILLQTGRRRRITEFLVNF